MLQWQATMLNDPQETKNDSHPPFSTIFKELLQNAESNVGKHTNARRHPALLKKFSTALFIYAGPLAYDFFHQNMPEALPSH